MNRRRFLGSLIGGVAATAAVRMWPFRVYSFPTELRKLPMDLGFNMFDYAGLPMIEGKRAGNNTAYFLNDHIWAIDGNIIRKVDCAVKRPLMHCQLEGLQA